MTAPRIAAAATLIALAAGCSTHATHTAASWPEDLRGHVTGVGPSGLGAIEVRTDLGADPETAVRVCQVARRQHPDEAVTVLGVTGNLLASSAGGSCASRR